MTEEEKKKLDAVFEMQIRNQAMLETILQTQTRILSKVKKERYERTKFGIKEVVEAMEKEIRERYKS